MYGIGMARALAISLKNLLLPSRMFTIHQYPDRRVGIFALAKLSGTSKVEFLFKNPKQAAKALIGMVKVEDRDPRHSRFRGEEFTFYEERCTGCASCAKYCPLGIIRIVTDRSGTFLEEGQKYGIEVFDIDIGRCMFCGLCVEACPYDALHMGSGFEEGSYTQEELVIDVDRLRQAPKRPSTWLRPQLENKGYDPFNNEELTWRDVGRHERPSLQNQEDKWANR